MGFLPQLPCAGSLIIVIGGIMDKFCNKCKTTKDTSMFYKDNSKKSKIRSLCKVCDNAKTDAWRENNMERYLARQRDRFKKDPKQRETNKNRSQRHRDDMSDMYIRSLLTKRSTNLKPEDITDDLIKFTRETLKLKRALKKL